MTSILSVVASAKVASWILVTFLTLKLFKKAFSKIQIKWFLTTEEYTTCSDFQIFDEVHVRLIKLYAKVICTNEKSKVKTFDRPALFYKIQEKLAANSIVSINLSFLEKLSGDMKFLQCM